MPRKIIYSTGLLLVVLSLTSCKKWLDLQPQDGIIRQEFWKTKEQVQAAVIGCYASLLGSPAGINDRPLVDYLFMWGELRADMLSPASGISNDEIDVMLVNLLETNSIVNWRALYRTINYCNTVIDFAPDVLQYDQTFTQQQLDAYLAEALTLRALMYFYLVRSFGEVPLKLVSTSNDGELQALAKSSQEDVLNQVITDLNIAELKAVLTYGNKAFDKGRVTRYTINALQADVYLWMEKYTECITACDKIISSGKFGLIAGNAGFYNTLYYNGNSNESIFEFQFDEQKLNPFYSMFIQGSRRYIANPRVMEEMFTIDFDDDTKKDIRGDGVSVRLSDGAVWKLTAFDFNTSRSASESYAHWIVYRYAEILLMKAEALAWTNKGQDALDIVQTIRDRAHALEATKRTPGPDDTENISEYILEERAREFAFEGKRWYDVLRHAKRNNYAYLQVLLNMVALSVPGDRQQIAINKYKDYNSHYFPIYQYELQTDKNLVQNPFYK